MGEPATEKQIGYAAKLGIDKPEQYDKQTLRGMIDAKLGNKPKEETQSQDPLSSNNGVIGQIGTTEGIGQVNHTFQSSYEFGPAGNRHTIKYNTIEDLKERMKELEDSGLFVESVKM